MTNALRIKWKKKKKHKRRNSCFSFISNIALVKKKKKEIEIACRFFGFSSPMDGMIWPTRCFQLLALSREYSLFCFFSLLFSSNPIRKRDGSEIIWFSTVMINFVFVLLWKKSENFLLESSTQWLKIIGGYYLMFNLFFSFFLFAPLFEPYFQI